MFSATLNKFYVRGLVGKRQKGVTMIEYALIAGLIVVVGYIGLALVGTKIAAIWPTISTAIPA